MITNTGPNCDLFDQTEGEEKALGFLSVLGSGGNNLTSSVGLVSGTGTWRTEGQTTPLVGE